MMFDHPVNQSRNLGGSQKHTDHPTIERLTAVRDQGTVRKALYDAVDESKSHSQQGPWCKKLQNIPVNIPP